jgi:hypothetical protein
VEQAIEQEQAKRLAVPDVDERQRAMRPAIGHQKIELLVDVDQRIAEQQQAKHQRQAEILEEQPQILQVDR